MTQVKETKFIAGKYERPVKLVYDCGRIYFHFSYNKKLIEEIKNLEGRKYHGFDKINPRKIWSAPDTIRNRFIIEFLEGKNPYYRYDIDLKDYKTSRPLRAHQIDMVRHILTRQTCICAYEMGLGKSLAWIEATEYLGLENHEIWYVGPRAGVKAVDRELKKWKAKFQPVMMTYDELVKRMKDWVPGNFAPKMVCFDESSKIKNPKAQRSEAALHLSNSMRIDYNDDCYIVLMSGTPAPKEPTDWWHQAEVAQPGFLKEPFAAALKHRCAMIEDRESLQGGVYPHLVTWLDNERKCSECGEFDEHENHQMQKYDSLRGIYIPNDKYHSFKPSVNEVNRLYNRLKGLVLIGFKKDCTDLPDKQYRLIHVKPTPDIIRAAKMIKEVSGRAITALNLMRELSDGFQYEKKPDGTEKCKACHGEGVIQGFKPEGNEDVPWEEPQFDIENKFSKAEVVCDACGGSGEKVIFSQGTKIIQTPKDKVLKEILEEHEDIGRFTVWGGFTATVDKIVKTCQQYGWAVLRVDGRGYMGVDPKGNQISTDVLLDCMDGSNERKNELLREYPKVCFVGHPKAGGMALTLTASPTALYYSNSFDGEARMQSEDRGHRIGMDENIGYTIIDLIHLPTDKLVLDNLYKKKKLQSLTMNEVTEALNTEVERYEYYD